ncbi:MAG: PfkB family carbohydrate kinase [Verrucomicrobiota bacterium]
MKILTFTANLLAETTYYVNGWTEGQTSRANRETFQVGGKGINVSKMLNRLNAENLALCFPGGNFGPATIDWLENEGIAHRAFIEDCVTRSGSIVRAPGKDETTVLGLDSYVSPKSIQSCIDYLNLTSAPYVFAICGSIPSWNSEKWKPLRNWIQNRPENVHLVVDCYGPALHWLVAQNPALIKINRQELETLFPDNKEEPTPKLLERTHPLSQTRLWVITDGANKIWFRDYEDIASHQPDEAKCISPVGCGDVFYATLLECLYNNAGYAMTEAISRASRYASLNAASEGIADFPM